MKTEIIKIDASNADRPEIAKASAVIDAGGLVAFPTETVYGIAARARNETIKRLNNIKNRPPDKPYTLHISPKSKIKEYVPALSLKGKKLVDKAWPGPLTIIFQLSDDEITIQKNKLDSELFQNLYHHSSVGLRCPEHRVACILLKNTTHPVLAPSANTSGGVPAVDAQAVEQNFAGKIELILDGGTCKYQEDSTIVKIQNNKLHILREGAYTKQQLEQLAKVKILFVCTGNTCRSPMAQGLFRKNLAEKLHSRLDEFDKLGYKVDSAGIVNTLSGQPTVEAINACAARGVDITGHRSRMITEQLLSESDLIFVMSHSHRDHVIACNAEAEDKCFLLAGNMEINDPLGRPQKVYNDCADIIEKAVKERISEIIK